MVPVKRAAMALKVGSEGSCMRAECYTASAQHCMSLGEVASSCRLSLFEVHCICGIHGSYASPGVVPPCIAVLVECH